MEHFSSSAINGDLRTLIRISLPVFVFLFCESLTAFGERIFLSYDGIEALSAALNGMYLAFIFQSPCIAIASMGQVFVGLYQGKGELKKIGPCIWQIIWFSLLSLIITLPLSLWSSSLYFKGTSIEQMGTRYFNILALGNFLFPLNTALSSFYLGRGKTLLVTLLMIASYAFNLGLCWALVFGVKGFIPALGIQGAALAKCLSMGLLCLLLLGFFLTRKNRECYETGIWQLSPTALWSYLRSGLTRAFGYLWTRICWAGISYMMIKKGGEYLDIQTVGGTIIAFLVFIPAGIYRAVLTIVPNLLGGRNYSEVWRFCRSLMIYMAIIGAVLLVPIVVYPQMLIYFFDASSRELFQQSFGRINHWVWLFLVANAIQMGLSGFIVAARKLRIQIYSYFFSTITSLLPVYLFLNLGKCAPDKLWFIMALENVIMGLIFFYFLRSKREGEELRADD